MNRVGRLHIITDEVVQDRWSHVELAKLAVEGGADVVQLRDKRPDKRNTMRLVARSMLEVTKGRVTLVVNDYVEIVEDLQSARSRKIVNPLSPSDTNTMRIGIHLGVDDCEPRAARRILGPDVLIGATVNSLAEVLKRSTQLFDHLPVAPLGVDYLGVGPVFGTTSKRGAAPELGLEGLRQIIEAQLELNATRDKPLPVIAIGGITPDRVSSVMKMGAQGVAVLSAVVCSKDPRQATREFVQALESCSPIPKPL